MSDIDFGAYSKDYAADRPGFPESFYERLDSISRIKNSRSLDLGTGPGTIALELAARGSSVEGVDISAELIQAARRGAKDRVLKDNVHFGVASAEKTGLDESSFDLATAGQCWHWFDGSAVMAEILRVLRPDGVLAIAYYSYLSEHSDIARETEELILEFNPSWTMAGSTGMFSDLIDEVVHGGFEFVEAFCYDHTEEFSHSRWRGRMRTCNGVGSGSLSPPDVKRFDDALARLLKRKYEDSVAIVHRVWCVVARKPS